MILACQNISKSFGEKEILRGVSFHIEEKEKLAIVGINGSGKTTLLKIIMGEETADEGQVVKSKDVNIGYLSQHQDVSFDDTIYAEMLKTKQEIIDTERRIRELEKLMHGREGEELEKLMEEYNTLTSFYDRENGYAYESEITGVLKGLGFTEADYDRHMNTLSGGQRMRVALGRLLLKKPELIILDEPTNHLDMPAIAWLEGYLASYPGAVIVVSHDRYFIDRVATKVVGIELKKATVYHGNYSYYAGKYKEIRESKLKAYMNQQAEIKHQQEVITKLKSFNREKSIKRAESREKMLDKMEVIERPETVRADMRMTLEPSIESGNDVLTVTGLAKSFGNTELFNGLDIEIKRGERVALIGGNGTGKTTILKMINRICPKDAGTVALGARVTIGYYDQEHQVLNPEKTIFDEISDSFPELNNTRIRNVLAAFLFTGDDVFKQIKDLSGGEKGRVSLAKLMLSPANFLVLDEPTNHLDINSKEILEDALKGYTGTVLVVSHDRYFINRIATRIIELKDKKLYNFIGDYDYYESHRDTVYSAESAGAKENVQPAEQASSSKESFLKDKEDRARLKKRENDLKKLEARIEQLEAELEEVDSAINLPENATNVGKLTELSEKREQLDAALVETYDEYYKLEEEA
ncbi:MAG: ABC-F family ATP-binding cassette domain-containing protein [Lachnospiraceae bacterium]|nr:ABC-F family ATP-binding cassette domain-containing protein [Lachnospiraceae bacterium]